MYMLKIYATITDENGYNKCRVQKYASYDFALERLEHFRKNWKFFSFATLAYFNGEFWEEIPV